MVRSTAQRTALNLLPLLERIVTLGQLSRQEHLELTSTILSNQWLQEEERQAINRIFDAVQTGRLKLVD